MLSCTTILRAGKQRSGKLPLEAKNTKTKQFNPKCKIDGFERLMGCSCKFQESLKTSQISGSVSVIQKALRGSVGKYWNLTPAYNYLPKSNGFPSAFQIGYEFLLLENIKHEQYSQEESGKCSCQPHHYSAGKP